MELGVIDTANVPKDRIISVRLGDIRRQAKLEKLRKHSLKFPCGIESNMEPLQIELLQVVAAAQVVLRPGEADYRVAFSGGPDCGGSACGCGKAGTADGAADRNKTDGAAAGMALGLRLRRCQPPATGGDSLATGGSCNTSAVGTSDPVASKLDDAAAVASANAKDYIERHGLLNYLEGMLSTIIKETPSDPYEYMRKQLDSVVGAAPARGTAPRESAVPSQPEGSQGSALATKNAPLAGECNAAEEELHMKSRIRKQLLLACESGILQQTLERMACQVEPTTRDVNDNDMRAQMRKALTAACESGLLARAMATVPIPPPTPKADPKMEAHAKSKIKSILTRSYNTGEFAEALTRIKDGDGSTPRKDDSEAAAEKKRALQLRMSKVLAEASNYGQLQWAMQAVANAKATAATPPPGPLPTPAEPPQGDPPVLPIEKPAPQAKVKGVAVTRDEFQLMQNMMVTLTEDNQSLHNHLERLSKQIVDLVQENQEMTQLAIARMTPG